MFDIVRTSQFKSGDRAREAPATGCTQTRAMTSRGCFRTWLRRSAVTPQTDRECRKRRRGRSARTERAVRDAGRRAEADGKRRIEAERRSQRRIPCDHGFAHKSSPTRRGHRGKMSVSNLVQSQSATLNVETFKVASSLSPLLLTGRSPCLASARCLLRISFRGIRDGCLRNFGTERPLSYCYELSLA